MSGTVFLVLSLMTFPRYRAMVSRESSCTIGELIVASLLEPASQFP